MKRIGLNILLLLAYALSALEQVSAGQSVVFSDDHVFLPNGEPAHVSVISDEDCAYVEDMATLDDGNNSTVLKDFQTGKSALIMSIEPDVCYIRDIPKGEMSLHQRKCVDGMVLVKPDQIIPKDITYEDGKELNVTDLSTTLAEFCGDRRIVELVVVGKSGHHNTRNCEQKVTKVCRVAPCCCRSVCVRPGWWFSQCVTETRCSRTEVCSSRMVCS